MFTAIESFIENRKFTICVQLLVIISVITFSVETLPNLSIETRRGLRIVEVFTVIVFTVEYFLRLLVGRLRFVFSFWGVIDFLAILPFYLAMGIDLRSLRAVRLLRLFRLFKLARYNAAIRRLQVALSSTKEEFILFACVTVMVLYLASVGIYFFEKEAQPEVFSSVFHSMWWALATLTTVGYGDSVPVTVGGRVFTFVILMIGLGVVAVPAGLLSSALTKSVEEKSRKPRRP